MSFQADYAAYCACHGVPERLELLLCDLNSVLRGKWLPGDQAEKLSQGKMRLPLSTYAPNILGEEVAASGLGIVVGDPDGVLIPVPGSLRPVPWAEIPAAQLQVEMADDSGGISPLSPRQHLQRMLERFAAHGWQPVVATELEFYLLQPRARAEDPPLPPELTPQAQNYDMELLDRTAPVLNDILAACKAQGLPTDTLIAEYGPGQFEINFHHSDDALQAADTALLFRRLVRHVALRHGLEASFMAKPYAAHPGNGLHAHVSVVDVAGRNIFDDGPDLSPRLKQAVAGVLHTMRDMQAIFAPHLNSLRRFGPNSFAPSAPEWGFDHRGAAVRIPQSTGTAARLEHRISGADVNPYLALTAILGGMLEGIERQMAPPPPLEATETATQAPLSSDWPTVVEHFAGSEFAAKIFGPAYRDIYVQVRRDEIAQIGTQISPVEYRAYLSRF